MLNAYKNRAEALVNNESGIVQPTFIGSSILLIAVGLAYVFLARLIWPMFLLGVSYLLLVVLPILVILRFKDFQKKSSHREYVVSLMILQDLSFLFMMIIFALASFVFGVMAANVDHGIILGAVFATIVLTIALTLFGFDRLLSHEQRSVTRKSIYSNTRFGGWLAATLSAMAFAAIRLFGASISSLADFEFNPLASLGFFLCIGLCMFFSFLFTYAISRDRKVLLSTHLNS